MWLFTLLWVYGIVVTLAYVDKTAIGQEYIAQLTSYKLLGHQEIIVSSLISDAIGHRVGIKFMSRSDTVLLAPTDFVLIRLFSNQKINIWSLIALTWNIDVICHRAEKELIRVLTMASGVKRIHVNKAYRHIELLSSSHHRHRDLIGQGVKVGIFDTGLSNDHIQSAKQRINWTNEKKSDDVVGHGTFVTSIIGSNEPECPGLAPDAEIYAFRTFTAEQLCFTSWFLDAFNYALYLGLNVLNLSTGGPDFHDLPFVEKIQELSANGMIIVSAVGNSGPKYGTLTNPADQIEVIGVGGLTREGKVASFSSRGMTTWELPFGNGRVKPDIVTLAEDIPGADISHGCKLLSGTSFAAPIVTAAVALLASIIPDPEARWALLNSASVKQILIETADQLEAKDIVRDHVVQNHIYEQGSGALNITRASEHVVRMWEAYQGYERNGSFNHSVTVFPAVIDATDCPYMWPLCSQPLFHSSLPLTVNLTLMNPSAVVGSLQSTPRWIPDNAIGEHLAISIAAHDKFWPYYGSLGVFIEVSASGSAIDGTASGALQFTINNSESTFSASLHFVTVPVRVRIIPTPVKSKRILWDQFHNIPYPSAFVPNDALEQNNELDSAGDHPHTNFHQLWNYLRISGYYIDILPFEYSCLDLQAYGVVLLVDPEEEYFNEELVVLHTAIKYHDVSLIVFADWYDERVLDSVQMFDTSTLSHWKPITGGANIPAINRLLSAFNIEFAHEVRSNDSISLLSSPIQSFPYWAGSYLTRFPVEGYLGYIQAVAPGVMNQSDSSTLIPVLGLYEVPSRNGGRIGVFGDSSCLDTSVQPASTGFRHCFDMLGTMLKFANQVIRPDTLKLHHLSAEYTDPSLSNAVYEVSLASVSSSGSQLHRSKLMEKHSKVLQARQHVPNRQTYCHFHHKQICS